MKLWLVRHAQPLIASGICYGVTDVAADTDLTLQAADALAKVLPPHTLCRASPLQRCQQLAAALQQIRPDLSITTSTYSNQCTDERLAEMDFGHHEGQPWANIPKAVVDAWTSDFGNHRFGGKESANEVLLRVKAALDDHAALGAANVLWLTHAGVIRAASLLAQGIHRVTSPQQWPQAVVEFGCFKNIDYSV